MKMNNLSPEEHIVQNEKARYTKKRREYIWSLLLLFCHCRLFWKKISGEILSKCQWCSWTPPSTPACLWESVNHIAHLWWTEIKPAWENGLQEANPSFWKGQYCCHYGKKHNLREAKSKAQKKGRWWRREGSWPSVPRRPISCREFCCENTRCCQENSNVDWVNNIHLQWGYDYKFLPFLKMDYAARDGIELGLWAFLRQSEWLREIYSAFWARVGTYVTIAGRSWELARRFDLNVNEEKS